MATPDHRLRAVLRRLARSRCSARRAPAPRMRLAHSRAGRRTRQSDLRDLSSGDDGKIRICQVLIDPEDWNDWQAEFTADLAQAREEGKPTLVLVSIGKIAG